VLWEHGNWGNNSAKLAAQVVNAFVTKQRRNAGNLMKVAESPKPEQVPVPDGTGGSAPSALPAEKPGKATGGQ
jgi:penicillin-binding protein 2